MVMFNSYVSLPEGIQNLASTSSDHHPFMTRFSENGMYPPHSGGHKARSLNPQRLCQVLGAVRES